MKKCEYCAKEISYFDQYCSEECQREAVKFYDLREKYTKLFSLINGICVFGIPVGLFILSFSVDTGFTIISFSTFILGLTIMFLPFPVENMITSMKIKKAVSVTRIIGLVLFVIGAVLVTLDLLIYIFKII